MTIAEQIDAALRGRYPHIAEAVSRRCLQRFQRGPVAAQRIEAVPVVVTKFYPTTAPHLRRFDNTAFVAMLDE